MEEQAGQAELEGSWGVRDVYSDGAGTPVATAAYGWLVGGIDEDSLEI